MIVIMIFSAGQCAEAQKERARVLRQGPMWPIQPYQSTPTVVAPPVIRQAPQSSPQPTLRWERKPDPLLEDVQRDLDKYFQEREREALDPP